MVNISQITKEHEFHVAKSVRSLLAAVPNVEFHSAHYDRAVDDTFTVDALIDFSCSGEGYSLVIELKSNGAPRFVRAAVYKLESFVARVRQSNKAIAPQRFIPMLVCPYLSPESRAICIDHDVAYLDFFGNARLTFDRVFIERTVPGRPIPETRALRSIFGPKAAAILRVLLRDPGRSWRVADLAGQAKASFGHVSKVRKALLDREWLEIRNDGAVLVQPDALLREWRENYRRPAGQSITAYTHLHGQPLTERLRRKLNPYPERPRAIYSLHTAAQWLAPFGRSGTATFYADEPGSGVLKAALELTPSGRGANVVVHIPTDENLFDDAIEPSPNVFCTNPIVTYLDLWNGSDRDREAAEHLAGELFPWLN